jgi:putative ABC transport system permease protein
MNVFNQSELMAIDVVARSAEAEPGVVAGVKAVLTERHRGEEDFTVTTQTEMLDTFGRIIGIITAAVTAIAGISLFVGAMGILTIMWISVHERTGRSACGARRHRAWSATVVSLEAQCWRWRRGVAGVGSASACRSRPGRSCPGCRTPPQRAPSRPLC